MIWVGGYRIFVLRAICAGGAMLAITNFCLASENLIHTFHGGDKGAFPNGIVAIRKNGRDDRFIGTTQSAGAGHAGTIFTIKQDGNMRVLHSFSVGSNGQYPLSAVISDDAGGWYGTTEEGGTYGFGVVFRLDQLGNYSVIYSFAGGTDGYYPDSPLVRDSAGNLYGTTPFGGAESSCQQSFAGCGTVFKVTPDGTETVLLAFQGGGSDGAAPMSELIMDSSGNLYGTASEGGGYSDSVYQYGCGTVFKLDPQGKESILHAFQCGVDGADPEGGLLMDKRGNLYGTTRSEGCAQFCIQGTVFKLTPGGKETILCTFSGEQGVSPQAALIADSKGNLYGTAWQGGPYGAGGVFEVTADGTEIDLHDFENDGHDGGYPTSPLVLDREGNLFGTTRQGGRHKDCPYQASTCGTVFEFTAADLKSIRARASQERP